MSPSSTKIKCGHFHSTTCINYQAVRKFIASPKDKRTQKGAGFLKNFTLFFKTGFVHFFRPKVQGLFKDFPGPYFEISRTFLYTNLPTAKQNVCVESYVLDVNTCTYRNTRKRELENTCKPDVCFALQL